MSTRWPHAQPFRNSRLASRRNAATTDTSGQVDGSAMFAGRFGGAAGRDFGTQRQCDQTAGTGEQVVRTSGAASSESASARVERAHGTQAEPERADKLDRRGGTVGPAMQIAQPVKALDGQREDRQQPADQQTVGVMVTDVLQPVARFAVVKPSFSLSHRLFAKRYSTRLLTRSRGQSVSQYASTTVPSRGCCR